MKGNLIAILLIAIGIGIITLLVRDLPSEAEAIEAIALENGLVAIQSTNEEQALPDGVYHLDCYLSDGSHFEVVSMKTPTFSNHGNVITVYPKGMQALVLYNLSNCRISIYMQPTRPNQPPQPARPTPRTLEYDDDV